jgi:uncharacterized SAM-binding protein YcdF (DUF218 family)
MIASPAELKPLLTALLLPPAGPLLMVAMGLWLFKRRSGKRWVALGLLTLWLLSCQAVAVWLGQHALPQQPPLAHAPSAQLAQLRAAGAQAVVVLGGGLLPESPEYGQPQPSAATAARLRYGVHLSQRSGLPLAFAGGVGWSNAGQDAPSEASAAVTFVAEHGLKLRWLEDQSRDTAENAAQMHALMAPEGVRRIVLVTHAWHMPRSQALFEKAGFDVLQAPMGFILPAERSLLEWLPSAHGLMASRQVLREWLALLIMRIRSA